MHNANGPRFLVQPYFPGSSLSFFFFYCSRDHRHLHSFPTRRSSDLYLCPPADGFRNRIVSVLILLFETDENTRSEEHTSELQSREKLVCRLLLEKKNHEQENADHV